MTREEFVSKYKVGDWVMTRLGDPRQILFLGSGFFVYRLVHGRESTSVYEQDWLPYTPPAPQRKKRLMSPAMFIYPGDKGPSVSDQLYESVSDAQTRRHVTFLSWPATQIIDGKRVPVQYEVEE